MGEDLIKMRQSDEEIIRTARLLAGHGQDGDGDEGEDDGRVVNPRLVDWTTELSARLDGGLSPALDPARLAEELAEKMKPFEAGGAQSYFPPAVQREAKARVVAEQRQQAAEALYAVEDWLRQQSAAVAAVVEASQRHPDPAEASSLTGGERMQLHVFVELRRGRRELYLRNSTAQGWAATYKDNPVSVEDLVDNELVEQLHAEGATPGPRGRTPTPEDLAAMQTLGRRIRQAREKRVPKQARELLDLMQAARIASSRARQLHKLTPVPPKRTEGVKPPRGMEGRAR